MKIQTPIEPSTEIIIQIIRLLKETKMPFALAVKEETGKAIAVTSDDPVDAVVAIHFIAKRLAYDTQEKPLAQEAYLMTVIHGVNELIQHSKE